MNYYRNVPHPFANTLAEELFQAGYIPSDTDFRIFRDYGGVPGLDMAYIFNGYVYHTKYDRINAFPRASFQHTGDNVLSLARALANAPELDDTAVSLEEIYHMGKSNHNPISGPLRGAQYILRLFGLVHDLLHGDDEHYCQCGGHIAGTPGCRHFHILYVPSFRLQLEGCPPSVFHQHCHSVCLPDFGHWSCLASGSFHGRC